MEALKENAIALIVLLGLFCLILAILTAILARSRFKLAQDAESWRNRHAEQAGAVAAAEARAVLLESQREALDLQIEREQTDRNQIEVTIAELRTRMDEQKRAADNRFSEIDSKRAHLKNDLANLTDQKTKTEENLAKAERERALLEQKLSAREAAHLAERTHLDQQAASLREGRETMQKEFKALAAETMRQQGDDLKKAAGDQLVGIVAPLKDNIGKFENEMRTAREAAARDQASLKTELLNLTKQSADVSNKAETLAKALRGDFQKQGAWGEMTLQRLLESAGLVEGVEYVSQESRTTEEGQRLRPDVVMKLPGEKELVIDSKVSLTAYDRAVNSEDEDERKVNLDAHVTSLQRHIRDLSSKSYSTQARGSADYVIMFVPIEGALSEALRTKSDLAELALDQQVMIATPTTLMMALRTIKNVWDVEKRTQNAEAIADRAGKLYSKVVGFVADLEKVGKHLTDANTVHQAAISKLSTGQGNVVWQVEKLKDLGAKTTKALPETLVNLSSDSD